MSAVRIPLDEVTRATLNGIESFVKANVASPKYKPLRLNDFMYVNVSKWCRYEQINFDGSCTPMAPNSLLGRGMYSITILADHVYVGPHRGGETFSLSLFVHQIAYKSEDRDMMEFIDSLNGQSPPPQAIITPQVPHKPKLKTKRGRPKKGLDEIDGPKDIGQFLQQAKPHHVL